MAAGVQPAARPPVPPSRIPLRREHQFHDAQRRCQEPFQVLRRYDAKFSGGITDLGLYGACTAADLMIYGLEHAGKDPTQASFIRNLRWVGSRKPERTMAWCALVRTTLNG
jgi:hypothetical protein